MGLLRVFFEWPSACHIVFGMFGLVLHPSPGAPMSETGVGYEQTIKNTHTRLKSNALNFWEVSAQAIALISPSMTAALIVPLMFGTAGTAGWLCYLFGTIMLLFVAINLNQFAK